MRLVNHIRGLLREEGLKIPVGMEAFWEEIPGKLKLLDFPPLQEHIRDAVYEARRMKQKEKQTESGLGRTFSG